jgi:hypothetical protein
MNYNRLIAAAVNLDIDYNKMSKELFNIQHRADAFSYPAYGTTATAFSLFLRTNPSFENYSYRGAKQANEKTWMWDSTLSLPYTQSIIDSLPFDPLGAVRVVYFPDVPCIEHTDWDDISDYSHTLGLSIIPTTGNTWCNVWSEQEEKYLPVPGNAMLLNDSVKHAVPKSQGTRIAIRIFGNINYSWFDDKIIKEFCYFN